MSTRTFLALVTIFSLTLAPCGAQLAQTPAATPAANQIIINVLGQVNRADRIVLPAGSGLLDALAAAGGFTRTADPARIIVIHKSAGEKPDVTKIDMKKIISGIEKDIRLKDGDTVEVGETIF